MKKYVQRIIVYILALTVLLSSVNCFSIINVSADGFDGDVVENPWGDLFKDPEDIDNPLPDNEYDNTDGNTGEKATIVSNKKAINAFKKSLKTKVVSATKSKKTAKTARVSLKKVKKAKGYQVQYSTNKKFKKSKTRTLKCKKYKFTIKKIKPGKTYYVRARAYGKYKGKTYYSAWSTRKVIKIKKSGK